MDDLKDFAETVLTSAAESFEGSRFVLPALAADERIGGEQGGARGGCSPP